MMRPTERLFVYSNSTLGSLNVGPYYNVAVAILHVLKLNEPKISESKQSTSKKSKNVYESVQDKIVKILQAIPKDVKVLNEMTAQDYALFDFRKFEDEDQFGKMKILEKITTKLPWTAEKNLGVKDYLEMKKQSTTTKESEKPSNPVGLFCYTISESSTKSRFSWSQKSAISLPQSTKFEFISVIYRGNTPYFVLHNGSKNSSAPENKNIRLVFASKIPIDLKINGYCIVYGYKPLVTHGPELTVDVRHEIDSSILFETSQKDSKDPFSRKRVHKQISAVHTFVSGIYGSHEESTESDSGGSDDEDDRTTKKGE